MGCKGRGRGAGDTSGSFGRGGGDGRRIGPGVGAVGGAGSTTVAGTLASGAATTYRVELFANAACDASGSGEGRDFLGAVDVATDAGGNGPGNADRFQC